MMPSLSFKNAGHALYQPLPQDAMDINSPKERAPQCGHESACSSHNACHAARRRRLLLMAFGIASALLLLAAAGLWYTYGCSGMMKMLGDSVGLVKRQANGGTTTDDGQGVFVKNKLYLIVLFVGLFICLVLGIMVSIWCCKGAFQNPLCCPCYLCACCGALTCLECISCGLCAESINQIGYE